MKLLREKQAQSEGNSLWGVINRSSQPLVTNILDSNQKYQAMRKQLDQDINVLPPSPSITNTTTSASQTNKPLSYPNLDSYRKKLIL